MQAIRTERSMLVLSRVVKRVRKVPRRTYKPSSPCLTLCVVLSFPRIPRSRNSTMSEEIFVKNVTKLDRKDYQIWKFQMNSLLVAPGVHDIISGDRCMPDDDATNAAARNLWVKGNAKAMVLISTIIESQLKCLLTCQRHVGSIERHP